MKLLLFVVSFSILYAVIRADPQEDLDAALAVCKAQFPTITDAVLDELKETRDIAKFQGSHKEINCFLFCVGKELKLLDDNGGVHFENMKTFTVFISQGTVNHDEAHASITKCVEASADDDLCEKVGKYAVCKIEQLKAKSASK